MGGTLTFFLRFVFLNQNMGSSMDKNMAKNRRIMQQTQVEMALKNRELMMAVKLAQAKDRLHWFGAFTATVACFSIIGAIKTRKATPLAPLLPLGFLTGFQADMVYGNKMWRV